ncbi:MAG: YkgJ family cysteine cluster protein [Bacteroidota bacterium]
MNSKPEDFSHCRPGCAACCIYVSISSPIPGMPDGKPAGTRCIHLTDELLCAIYNDASRPAVCDAFRFDPMICGENAEEAKESIIQLEGIG